MQIVEKYIADDGKEFLSYGECYNYETSKRFQILNRDSVFFDKNGDRIVLQNYNYVYDNVRYIILGSEESAKIFREIWYETTGFWHEFIEGGKYFFNQHKEIFDSYSSFEKEYQKLKTIFESAKVK